MDIEEYVTRVVSPGLWPGEQVVAGLGGWDPEEERISLHPFREVARAAQLLRPGFEEPERALALTTHRVIEIVEGTVTGDVFLPDVTRISVSMLREDRYFDPDERGSPKAVLRVASPHGTVEAGSSWFRARDRFLADVEAVARAAGSSAPQTPRHTFLRAAPGLVFLGLGGLVAALRTADGDGAAGIASGATFVAVGLFLIWFLRAPRSRWDPALRPAGTQRPAGALAAAPVSTPTSPRDDLAAWFDAQVRPLLQPGEAIVMAANGHDPDAPAADGVAWRVLCLTNQRILLVDRGRLVDQVRFHEARTLEIAPHGSATSLSVQVDPKRSLRLAGEPGALQRLLAALSAATALPIR